MKADIYKSRSGVLVIVPYSTDPQTVMPADEYTKYKPLALRKTEEINETQKRAGADMHKVMIDIEERSYSVVKAGFKVGV